MTKTSTLAARETRTLNYGARQGVRRTAFGIVASAAVLSVVTLLMALPSRAATVTEAQGASMSSVQIVQTLEANR